MDRPQLLTALRAIDAEKEAEGWHPDDEALPSFGYLYRQPDGRPLRWSWAPREMIELASRRSSTPGQLLTLFAIGLRESEMRPLMVATATPDMCGAVFTAEGWAAAYERTPRTADAKAREAIVTEAADRRTIHELPEDLREEVRWTIGATFGATTAACVTRSRHSGEVEASEVAASSGGVPAGLLRVVRQLEAIHAERAAADNPVAAFMRAAIRDRLS